MAGTQKQEKMHKITNKQTNSK